MARKLVTIQKISEINPIDGADKIELCKILSWQCVVLKEHNLKVGDLVVYFEIDSILPKRPEFEFLASVNYRIKTRRFKGVISQGLVMPLSILNGLKHESDIRDSPTYDFKEGDDVTTLIGVELYQPAIPACLAGKVKGQFPSFLVKTDQTRVEVLQNVLERHADTFCAITEKVDGASCTIFYNRGEFGVCSRNLELLETPDNTFWKLVRKYDIEKKLKEYGGNIALQGEVFGEGIQKNPLKIKGQDIRFFDIFDIDRFRYYDFPDFLGIITRLGLPHIPIITDVHALVSKPEFYIFMADGNSLINEKCKREGIVVKPLREEMDLEMSKSFGSGRISFKAVSREYLSEEK